MSDIKYPPNVGNNVPPEHSGQSTSNPNEWWDMWLISKTTTPGEKLVDTKTGDCPRKTATGQGADTPQPPPTKWKTEIWQKYNHIEETWAIARYELGTSILWWGGMIVGVIGVVLVGVGTFGVGLAASTTVFTISMTGASIAAAGTIGGSIGGLMINGSSGRYKRSDFIGFSKIVVQADEDLGAPENREVVKCP